MWLFRNDGLIQLKINSLAVETKCRPRAARVALQHLTRPCSLNEDLVANDMLTTGQSGLSGARDRQPEHGGPDSAHFWRSPAANLHADAPWLVSAFRQLVLLQETGANQQHQSQGKLSLRQIKKSTTSPSTSLAHADDRSRHINRDHL